MLVRASIGSLAAMGLYQINVDVKPTTCYLLQYSGSGCSAGCLFCPQSSYNLSSKEFVSRVPWPPIELEALLHNIGSGNFSRICLQTILKKDFEKEASSIIRRLSEVVSNIPVSIGTTPVSEETLYEFRSLGVDFIGVGLDVASNRIFDKIKMPFKMEDFWNFIKMCVNVFNGNVFVHLIYGLGENDTEFAYTMEKVYEIGAEVALFSFTPIGGTKLEHLPQPEIERYRLMQIIRYFLSKGYKLKEVIEEDGGRIKLKVNVDVHEIKGAFLTSGCPACNRPFYNERPTKVYNYPSPSLLDKEIELIGSQIRKLLA